MGRPRSAAWDVADGNYGSAAMGAGLPFAGKLLGPLFQGGSKGGKLIKDPLLGGGKTGTGAGKIGGSGSAKVGDAAKLNPGNKLASPPKQGLIAKPDPTIKQGPPGPTAKIQEPAGGKVGGSSQGQPASVNNPNGKMPAKTNQPAPTAKTTVPSVPVKPVFRQKPDVIGGAPTSIKKLKAALGKTGLLDSAKYALRLASPKELATVGNNVMGWIIQTGGKVLRDSRGRPIIKLTPNALSSLKEAVITVGHELRHIKDILAGSGLSEAVAEAAGKAFWRRFLRNWR